MSKILSPLDTRYKNVVSPIASIYSDEELTLLKFRIELDYFECFMKFVGIEYDVQSVEDIKQTQYSPELLHHNIKQIEKDTKHDIKAIEYFIKGLINANGYKDYSEYVHYGLTSQDIVSLSTVIAIKKLNHEISAINTSLHDALGKLKYDNDKKLLIGRTHGQPGLLISLASIIDRYEYRLHGSSINSGDLLCKFGGALGDFRSLTFTFPDKDWFTFLDDFVTSHGIRRTPITTQTDNWDSVCDGFDVLSKRCTILINMCQDFWDYISRDIFTLKNSKEYVGSSTMAQKVNPINFENAEGNFQIAHMWFSFFSNKLRTSRLQRDLSDSTVIRNFGLAYGYYYLAITSLIRGIEQLAFDDATEQNALDNNYHLLSEFVQLELKNCGIKNSYEVVKNKFQYKKSMNKDEYIEILNSIINPEIDVLNLNRTKDSNLRIEKLNNSYNKLYNLNPAIIR